MPSIHVFTFITLLAGTALAGVANSHDAQKTMGKAAEAQIDARDSLIALDRIPDHPIARDVDDYGLDVMNSNDLTTLHDKDVTRIVVTTPESTFRATRTSIGLVTNTITSLYEVVETATLPSGYSMTNDAGELVVLQYPTPTTQTWTRADRYVDILSHVGYTDYATHAKHAKHANAGVSVQVPALASSLAAVAGVLTGFAAFAL